MFDTAAAKLNIPFFHLSDNNLETTYKKGSKHKKHARPSKMAARLDGSDASVELSPVKDGMEGQDANG